MSPTLPRTWMRTLAVLGAGCIAGLWIFWPPLDVFTSTIWAVATLCLAVAMITAIRVGTFFVLFVCVLAAAADVHVAGAFAPSSAVRSAAKGAWHVVAFAFPDPATGVVDANGPNIGHWHMVVDRCRSGQYEQFFGVVFFDSDDPRLAIKVVQPPIGSAQFAVNETSVDRAVVYERSDCRVIDVALARGSSTYNDIWNMHGHVRFECGDTNNHITGNLSANNCH